MFLRRNRRKKDGTVYEYWTLVESVRTARGPRQRVVATLGKLPGLDRDEQAGWDEIARLLDGVPRTAGTRDLFEPEAPRAGMSLAELQGCLDWVAHGFEIVHTHFEGWRFTAADCVADFALHGRLRVGPRVPVQDWKTLAEDMAALRVELLCDGKVMDRGQGAVVLDGPLNALRLWVDAMAEFTPDWPIRPGDVVTTGTITDAWPLLPGQRWQTRLSDARLYALTLKTV